MTVSRFETIVATHWLRQRLFTGTSSSKQAAASMRILDASVAIDPKIDGYKEFYQQSHIPTASFFSLYKLCLPSPSSYHKFPVPDANRFQDYVESLGISNDTHVITYDRANSVFSLKTWWLFRLFGHKNVSVLDGGFTKWIADGYEVTTEEPVVERSSFKPAYNLKLLYNFEDMVETLKKQDAQIVDTRPPAAFHNQKDKLPERFLSGGHLPGSTPLPYPSLLKEDGTFKELSDLKSVIKEAGVDLDLPMIATCQRGLTACGLAAAAQMLGKEDIPVYNGSFREWSQRASPDQIVSD